MFLEKILSGRRQCPAPAPDVLRSWIEQAARLPPTRGFARALQTSPKPAVIAEFKRASPSKGRLRAEMDPALRARDYESGGACALSILTEPDHFLGSAEDLHQARQATALPVLRKDFLLHDWEIYQSRCWGADAILLIAAALDDLRLGKMLELCRGVGLDALVEVHTPEEAVRVSRLGAPLVGINNRDLVSFAVDLAVTERILPLLSHDCLKISESGFETPEQLARFPEVDAFLIGETLVRTEDPTECLKRLRGVQSFAKDR